MRFCVYVAKHYQVSRRKAGELIKNGDVKVSGIVQVDQSLQIEAGADVELTVKGNYVPVQVCPMHYFILNKGKNCVCSHVVGENVTSVYSLFSNVKEKLFSVGRLDKDTTGLLVVTNDGELCQKFVHPRNNIIKTYLVIGWNCISKEQVQKIQQGMWLRNKYIKPVAVKQQSMYRIEISVGEGVKHEIRCLVKHAKIALRELSRVSLGGLSLRSIKIGVGQYISMSREHLIRAVTGK